MPMHCKPSKLSPVYTSKTGPKFYTAPWVTAGEYSVNCFAAIK